MALNEEILYGKQQDRRDGTQPQTAALETHTEFLINPPVPNESPTSTDSYATYTQ
jgi:hypothetical protein